MRYCVVCGLRERKGKILFGFSKIQEKRTQWLEALGHDEENISSSHVVCEDHFGPDSWERVREDGKKKLKPSAVPVKSFAIRTERQAFQDISNTRGRNSTDLSEIHFSRRSALSSDSVDHQYFRNRLAHRTGKSSENSNEALPHQTQSLNVSEIEEHPTPSPVNILGKPRNDIENSRSFAGVQIATVRSCGASSAFPSNNPDTPSWNIDHHYFGNQPRGRVSKSCENSNEAIPDQTQSLNVSDIEEHSTSSPVNILEKPTNDIENSRSLEGVRIATVRSCGAISVFPSNNPDTPSWKLDHHYFGNQPRGRASKSYENSNAALPDQTQSLNVSDIEEHSTPSPVNILEKSTNDLEHSRSFVGVQNGTTAANSDSELQDFYTAENVNVLDQEDTVTGPFPEANIGKSTAPLEKSVPDLELAEILLQLQGSNNEDAVCVEPHQMSSPEISVRQEHPISDTIKIPVYQLSGNVRTLQDIRRLEDENKALKAALLEMEKKTELMTKKAEQIYKQNHRLRQVNKQVKKDIKRLKLSTTQQLEKFRSRFRADQLAGLSRRSNRGLHWRSASYQEGLVWKMKFGTKAYIEFIKKYPMWPSVRSLQHLVQGMPFHSGILLEVFAMIEGEMPSIHLKDRRCVVFTDEMAIKEGEIWDASAKRFIGKATFPHHQGLAKKALVIMIAHLATRRKYAVAWFLTSSAGKKRKRKDDQSNKVGEARKNSDRSNKVGEALRDIIFEVIRKGESIGLLVDAVVSDMGADNQALWKAVGIFCNSSGQLNCSIAHPVRQSDKLWFMPDPMHLSKNILSMLSSNKTILLSNDVIVEENLDQAEVKLEDLKELLTFESEFELKVAFRLKQEKLECKNQYDKMKVGTTRSVFNKRTETALKMHAAETGVKNSATTFFVGLVSDWFTVVSNRGQQMALRQSNMDAYNKALNTLKKIIKVFRRMRVGKKGLWKPVQTGIIIACTCLLEMQKFLLEDCGFSYLILARFLQDCLENLFSLIRFRQAVPNALAFKDNLKVITLAQVCLTATNTSYFVDCDESEMSKLQTDFLQLCKNLSASRREEAELPALIETSTIEIPEVRDEHLSYIDSWEWTVIYDMAGAVIHSLKTKNSTLCPSCIDAVLWHGEGHHPCSIVVQLRNYKAGALIEVSDECFKALLKAEITFRETRDVLRVLEHADILDFLVSKLMYVWAASNVPTCHSITRKILERFLTMRFKTYCLKLRQELAKNSKKREYNSKSMAMHAAVS